MNFVIGNIWAATLPVMIVIPSNSQTNDNGDLHMEFDIEEQASKKLPTLAREAGRVSREKMGEYGFVVIRHPRTEGKAGISLLQVRKMLFDPTQLLMLDKTLPLLAEYAQYNADIPIRLAIPYSNNATLTGKIKYTLTEVLGDISNISIYIPT
jgi:hypothetical protein